MRERAQEMSGSGMQRQTESIDFYMKTNLIVVV